MPPETELPATPSKPRTPTPPPVVAKQSLELPVWPPRNEPAVREPDMLPPPPAAGFEDWENPNANTSLGNRVPSPSTDVASDFKREDSVIIDLNAVARESGAARRPQTYPVIQTSEQSTTTSGVFVMPTAAAPKAVEAPLAAAHVATPAPTMPEPTVASSPFQRPSSAWHTPMPQPLPGEPTAAPPVPSFPSAAGLIDDLAVPSPIKADHTEPALARRTLLATVFPTPQRRRTVLLVAGGSIGLVMVLIVALSGGSHAPKTEPTTVAKVTTSSETPATTTSSTPSPAAAHVAVATTDTVPDKLEAPAQPTKKPVVAKRRNFRAKKPVILDYDKKQDPTPSQDEALARARAAYATGNQHLFAGQTDAAIASYHQALADYPGYVAGYRGLGLAYAQQGNRSAALTAFKTYVGLAPTAKDVALIEKRISSLSIGAH
jgi:Flp pilus assembly protein TadD